MTSIARYIEIYQSHLVLSRNEFFSVLHLKCFTQKKRIDDRVTKDCIRLTSYSKNIPSFIVAKNRLPPLVFYRHIILLVYYLLFVSVNSPISCALNVYTYSRHVCTP